MAACSVAAAALTKLEQIVHIHGAVAVEVLAVDASGAELAEKLEKIVDVDPAERDSAGHEQ